MGFKLKSKGELFGINEELSEFGRPVFEKKLEPGIIAEANRDGTTFVSKDASEKEKRDAIGHEEEHQKQFLQNKLQYTDHIVTWKKDTRSPARVYERLDNGMLASAGKKIKEGDGNQLEWETEAYLNENS
jgi:hypothetical protein